MAEIILSPLLNIIFGELASSAMREVQLVWGVDEELQNLKSSLTTIQAVLEDAEEKQFESNAISNWLCKLKYVAYDADDLVDEIATEAQQSETAESGTDAGDKKKKKRQQVLDNIITCFNCIKSPYRRQEMVIRIREINAQLDQIAKERRDFHLETRHGHKQHEIVPERRQPESSVRDESSQVLGRDNDTEQIIRSLLSADSSKTKFSVIAIVGMGGVGKTTLAQVVYNDKRVIDNFELRAWICVSTDFDVKRVTKEIIESVSKISFDLSDIDSLQCFLRDKLDGKKFLLLLDDVWSENGSDWDRLRPPFTFGAKGSKIVVTTRSQAVSNAMQATTTHYLNCLSKQDCWSLFVNQAFKDDNANAYPELINIGEKLVKKCGGLPLAAKALGGLLSSKRQTKEWENILKSPIWNWRGLASNILPALRLSYQYLPAYLKHCFTFCSIFPKNYEFEEKELILLWVALGFIQPEEDKKIENTASEYFNDLLLRSFFQLSNDLESTAYKMHDLIHDLAQFMSSDECIQMEHGKSRGVHAKTRHLSYSVTRGEVINLELFYESKGLRTFLIMNANMDEKVQHNLLASMYEGVLHHVSATMDEKQLYNMFDRLRCIRVLDLSRINITDLPKSIGKLKHLRYLNLSKTGIKELPESIVTIYNMQTLLLRSCKKLLMLPDEMRKLTNMRHLDLEGCWNIESMPPQIGRLTFLQTLPWFVVSRERERSIVELKGLTSINGKLVIKKLENVIDAADAGQSNLKNKPYIDCLSLEWSIGHDWRAQDRLEEELLEGLQPHPSLKRLELDGYMDNRFSSWMMTMDTCFSNLTTVDLRNCKRCSILPPLGSLPSLSYLKIRGMDQVEHMGARGGFPSLKEFVLSNMDKLQQWQVRSGEMAVLLCLQSLSIWHCSLLQQIRITCSNSLSNLTKLSTKNCARLVSLPQLPSLKELYFERLDNLEEWCDVVGGEAHFPHLEDLRIYHCPRMRQWPDILPVLTQLTIRNCKGLNELPPFLSPSLSSLTFGGLVSVRLLNSVSCLSSLLSLNIGRIPYLTSMPKGMLQALIQLESLITDGCDELVTLEDEVLPSTLKYLRICHCHNLKSLPRALHTFTSLLGLEISYCPHMASLPEEGLPSSLEQVVIAGCPMLMERCLEGVGEDWPKISHIPDIIVFA